MIYLKDGSVVPVDKSGASNYSPTDVDLNSSGNPLDNHPEWKKLFIKVQENLR